MESQEWRLSNDGQNLLSVRSLEVVGVRLTLSTRAFFLLLIKSGKMNRGIT